jgi:DNA repair protein RadD
LKQLRPYQREAIDSLYNYWKTEKGHGLLVLPTGAGKSLLLSALIKEICTNWPGTRILVLAHVRELLTQSYEELLHYWPEAPVGLYSAGLSRRDFQAQVLIAGIQSIAKHTQNLFPPPEIVIVDECHLIARTETTRYNATIRLLEQMYPHLRVVGLSATPYRLDSGYLHKGEGKIFDRIVYDVPVQRLIDEGYLAPVRTPRVDRLIDTQSVHHSGGEFVAGELEAQVMIGDTTARAISDLLVKGKDRKKWLIFCCGLKHAAEVSAALTSHGIRNEVITGDTPKAQRDRIIQEYKEGSLDPVRALVSVGVLTTGFNAPAVDLICLLRPTESVGLYVQMVGRGTRNAPGKVDCLVLDYAGNILRHGPIDAVNPDNKPWNDGDGVAPAKECPACHMMIHAAVRLCPVCGYAFPESEYKIERKASEAPILKAQVEPDELEVWSTEWVLHRKEGKKDSVRVNFSTGLATISEWIFPESSTQWGDFFYRKTCKELGLAAPYPVTAMDFLDRILPEAEKIWVVKEGKWDRVKRHVWKKTEEVYSDCVPF